MNKKNQTTIRGIVIASCWRSNGSISALDIASFDEKLYRVVNDAMGNKLRAHVKQLVVAEGILAIRCNRTHFYIREFHIETPSSNDR